MTDRREYKFRVYTGTQDYIFSLAGVGEVDALKTVESYVRENIITVVSFEDRRKNLIDFGKVWRVESLGPITEPPEVTVTVL